MYKLIATMLHIFGFDDHARLDALNMPKDGG